MAQSLAKILVHLIFSTKNRSAVLSEDVRAELEAYMVGILRNLESPSLLAKAVADHVHVLFRLSRKQALSKVVEELKVGTSKWIKTKGDAWKAFHWQNGYGAFSVSESNAASVMKYIADQEEHHRTRTFEEEFRAFLDKHGIEYDERYVWD